VRFKLKWLWYIAPLVLILAAVLILSTRPREVLPEITLPPDSILDVDWSPDGTQIALARHDGSFELRDVETNTVIRSLRTSDSARVLEVTFSPDGQRIASGDEAGLVRVWDVSSGDLIHTLRGRSQDQIHALVWRADGARIAAGRLFESYVDVWDSISGEFLLSVPQFGFLYALDWTAFGNRIAAGVSSRGVVVLDGDSAVQRSSYGTETLDMEMTSVAWSPDGTRLAGGTHRGVIYIWNAASEITHIIEGHAYYVVGLAWSPDGTRLVAVGSTASPHGGIEFIDVDPLLLP
jgi:WD40 repeat protein